MSDSLYEAQMLAAKYKAERDQARQEADRMRPAYEWVSKNGGIDSVENDLDEYMRIAIRVTLMLFKDCCPTRIADIEEITGELEKRLMPPGMEWLLEVWPKWSNGDYCKFGDLWVAPTYGDNEPRPLSKMSIYAPDQLREWGQDEGDNFGYEWDFMRPADTKYRPDKIERTDPIGADGLPIKKGDTVWHEDGTELKVMGFDHEEDGEMLVNVRYVSGPTNWSMVRSLSITHTKPEPPDSWERLESDMADDMAQQQCGPVSPEVSTAHAAEFVRRAKALAERGGDEPL